MNYSIIPSLILLIRSGLNSSTKMNSSIFTDLSSESIAKSFTEIATAFVESIEKTLANGFRWASGFTEFSVEIIYVILAISFLLFLIRWKRSRNSNSPLEGWLHTVNVILFLLLSLVEIFYVMAMGSRTIWFCYPNEVGWGWTIANFIVFAVVVYNQFMCYFNTLRDIQYNSYASFTWKWGNYSWPIALVGIIVAGFFYEPGILIVSSLFLIAQVVQIVIIFKNVLPKGGFFHALVCTVVYLIGSIATVAILMHFLVLLIIVIIGYFILMIFGSGGDTKYCSKCGKPLTSDNVCTHCRVKWTF